MTETPKDFIDRTMRKKVTAAGEESGGISMVPHGHKSITYAITEISDPDKFAAIAKKYPKNTRNRDKKQNELSWWGSSDKIREKVIIAISNQDVKVYLSTEMNRQDKTDSSEERFLRVLKDAAGAMIDHTDADHIDFKLDNNPYVPTDVIDREIGDMAAAKNKTASIAHLRSFDEPIIQTQDFIAGSADSQTFIDIIEDKMMSWKKRR